MAKWKNEEYVRSSTFETDCSTGIDSRTDIIDDQSDKWDQ